MCSYRRLLAALLARHACGVFRLFGCATCSAVAALSWLGVGRACRFVATPLRTILVGERPAGFRAETTACLTRSAFAALGKAGLRTLERRIELVAESTARRCRTISPRRRRPAVATAKAAITTEAAVAFTALKTTEAAFAALAVVRAAGVRSALEAARTIIAGRATKALRPLRAIATLCPPTGRALVFDARQTAFTRGNIALEAGATAIIGSTRRIEARCIFTVTRRGTITPIKAISAVVSEAATAAIICLARTIRRCAIKRTLAAEACTTGATTAIAARTRRGITLEATARTLTAAKTTSEATIATATTVATAAATKATAVAAR